MLDARNIYRKVTRKINDFSPEQMQNLAAIIWLHRGQRKRFLGLIEDYLSRICAESAAIPPSLTSFETGLFEIRRQLDALNTAVQGHGDIGAEKRKTFGEAVNELGEACALYGIDAKTLLGGLKAFERKYSNAVPVENEAQHKARQAFDGNAEAIRGLVKQMDLLYKLTSRAADLGAELAADEVIAAHYDRRVAGRLIKQLATTRKSSADQLKHSVYFHRQVAWLQDRFPNGELKSVPGLVTLVDRAEIEEADWSLTPGRYVGVAPPEEDEDFDFEQVLRDIHAELADLNKEAANLAAKIQENFEELGI